MTVSIVSGIPIYAGPIDIVTSIQAPNIPGGAAIGIGDIIGLQDVLDTKLQDLIGTIAPNIASVTITGAELNYLAGVTSLIQPQLDGKVDIAGDTMTGNLLFGASVQLEADAGTFGLPSIVCVGDLDTGFFWPAADTLGISVGGLDSFRVLSNGLLESQIAAYDTLVTAGSDGSIPNKKYVDDEILAAIGGPFLPLLGGTMTGDINVDANNLTFDADFDTYFTSSVDDVLTLYIGGFLEFVWDATSLDVGGTAVTKFIQNVTDPVNPQDAATMNYVDTELADFLPLAGGTMAGAIAMGDNLITGVTDPSAAQDAATMNYVDTEITALNLTTGPYLELIGGTMSGAIDMGSEQINNVADPTAAQDAVTLLYADTNYMPVDGSVPATGDLDAGGNNIINVADPVNAQDAATKAWSEASFLDLAGTSSMLGALDMGSNTIGSLSPATANDEAVNLGQTDGLYMPIGGGTPATGNLDMGGFKVIDLGTPTIGTDATTKDYVDTFLPLGGGTMSGVIAMGANKITGVADPTLDQDAATKVYVDNLVAGGGGSFVEIAGDTMSGDLIMGAGAQHSADGSASDGAPSYAFTGALDTGIWYDSNIHFVIGGDKALTVSPAGGANEVDVYGRQVVGVADPTGDDHAVTKGYLESLSTVKLLGSVTGVDLLSTGTTTVYTIPAGKMHIITQVIVRATDYTPGGAPSNPEASVGITGTFDQIVENDTVLDWGGAAGAADQVVYLQPKDGADSPNALDLVRFQVDTAGGGTFSALTATVYVLGIEL